MILRKFNQSDSSQVTELLEDGVVSKTTSNIPHPYTQQDASKWIAQSLSESATRFPFAVLVNDQLVGCVSYWAEGNDTEIGYWIGAEYQGKGYCTQAVKLLLKEPSFPPTKKVIAKTMLGNTASEKVLNKLGFNYSNNGFIRSKGKSVECKFYEKQI